MTAAIPGPDVSEIHVWTISLTASESGIRTFRSWLNGVEKARAERFAFAHLRRRYELSQGALRLLLGHYSGRDPRVLEFSFGVSGKPAVSDDPELRFNKSDSGDLAVYAIANGCDVGVDVEQLRDVADAERIAAQYFSPEETTELLRENAAVGRREAFFRCWTRKEAYIKAVGGGLSIPLSEFQVTLSRADRPRILRIGDDFSAGAGWVLEHLEPAEGFIGALAYASRRRSLRFHGLIDCDSLLGRMSGPQIGTESATETDGVV
jgi:4'-phosphopantetheinyl transferase